MAKWTAVDQSQNLYQCTVTIANGASESEAINLGGRAWGMVILPAGWTAAKLGMKVGLTSGGTFYGPVKDQAGALVLATVAASDAIALPQGDNHVWGPFVKLVSCDASGVAVNQGADRVLTLLVRTMHQ